MLIQFLDWEDPLEQEMATDSSVYTWKIPWMEEHGGLQSLGAHRVRHDGVRMYLDLYPSTAWEASSILDWRVPWREDLVGLWSIGSQRVGND